LATMCVMCVVEYLPYIVSFFFSIVISLGGHLVTNGLDYVHSDFIFNQQLIHILSTWIDSFNSR
jgi:hypothetical protein